MKDRTVFKAWMACLFALTLSVQIHAQPKAGRDSGVLDFDIGTNSAAFIGNQGQIYDGAGNYRDDVDFMASFGGLNMYFTDHGVVYHFYKVEPSKYDLIRSGKIENPYTNQEWEQINKDISEGKMDMDLVETRGQQYRIDIEFPGADLSRPSGEKMQRETRNYFNPRYPDGLYGVGAYSQIRYSSVYPGIDLIFFFEDGNLKYDFEVAANADPSQIKILYKGQQNITLDDAGNAVVTILPGTIMEKSPVAFQSGNIVPAQFVLADDTLMFEVGNYNSSLPLTIDPALTWSTYFYDNSTSGAFTYTRPQWDSNGNMFIVLDTYAITFPTVNPGGTSYYLFTPGDNGLQMVIMKFDPFRNLVWATYYTSSQSASTNFNNQGLVIDQNGDIYCVGHMFFVYGSPAAAFPTSIPVGAYSETTPGNNRNFILKFDNDGTRLWSTIFCTATPASSSGLDISGLAIDGSNRLLLVGDTYTPPSWVAMPLVNPGGTYYYNSAPAESAVPTLHRFNTALALEYSTYISRGVASEYFNYGSSIALDASNNLFISNSGTGNITTANPGAGAYIDGTGGTGRKLILYKFLSTGALNWCTLYGGTTSANSIIWQDVRDVKVAANGDVIFVGRVNTTDFPTYDAGSGAFYKSALSVGGTAVCDGIILKFSNAGVRLWATYIGGDGTSDGTDLMGLAIDGNNNIYTSGICRSTVFPTQTLAGSYNQSVMTGSYAIILNMFNSSGVRLWGTYFGTGTWMLSGGFGADDWVCGGVKLMQLGSSPAATPITTLNPGGGAYFNSTIEGTTCDFFAEFHYGTLTGSDATITPAGPFCISDAATTLSAVDPGGAWSGTGITNTATGAFDPATAGVGSYEIIYTISGVCGDADTINIVVSTEVDAAMNAAGPFCVNDAATTLTSVNAGGTWAGTGITNTSAGTFDPATAGVGTHEIRYTTTGSCSDTDTMNVVVTAVLDATITPAGPFCVSGSVVTLTAATPGGSWTGNGITNLLTGSFNPAMAGAGTHEITYTTSGSCADSDTIQVSVVSQLDATINAVPDLCTTDAIYTVTAANPGGTWSGNGIINASTGAFDPAVAGIGTQAVTYTISGDCGDTDDVQIVVRDCDDLDYHAIVPNVFSPNGDGANDVLYVRGYGVQVLSFVLYDRLGEKVFETNSLISGWDGTFRGKEMDPAVFTYVLEVTFTDNTTKFEKGNITLIK